MTPSISPSNSTGSTTRSAGRASTRPDRMVNAPSGRTRIVRRGGGLADQPLTRRHGHAAGRHVAVGGGQPQPPGPLVDQEERAELASTSGVTSVMIMRQTSSASR